MKIRANIAAMMLETARGAWSALPAFGAVSGAGELVAAPSAVLVLDGCEVELGFDGPAGVFVEVTGTESVGVGAVAVATTTLCVCAAGVNVEVDVLPNSGCALCAEQKLMKGSNSGSTYTCNEDFVVSPLAVTQSLQAPRSVSKAEPGSQSAGDLPTFCASM